MCELKFFLTVALVSGWALLGWGGETTKYTFTAEQSNGGVRVVTEKKATAVMLNAAADTKQQIVWNADPAIPAGLWQVDVDFYLVGKAHRSIFLEFESGGKTRVDLYSMPFKNNTFGFRLGYYAAQPTTSLVLRKSSQRNLDTMAVVGMTFTPLAEKELTRLPLCLILAVKDGEVQLPMALPEGNYQVRSAVPVVLKWISKDSRSFQTPKANTVLVALQGGEKITVADGKITQLIMERSYPAALPEMKAGNTPLIKVTDSASSESRTLVMNGYQGKQLPVLALFPGGKPLALVTTWDDGPNTDFQLMRTLAPYGVKATLFMNRHSPMIARMKELEAMGAEIGSHSWSHPWYHLSSPARCVSESVEMRRFLEQQLGHPVISFAFPFGYVAAYDAQGDYVLRSLREAGYWAGRSTATGDNMIDHIAEPLALRTNGHFLQGADKVKAKLEALKKQPGAIMYIWGHSYELAGDGQKKLEEVMKIVGAQAEIWYATQGDLMIWQWMRKETKTAFGPSASDGSAVVVLSRPWLHPWLRSVPLTLTVPEGVKTVTWQGQIIPVVHGQVSLDWEIRNHS